MSEVVAEFLPSDLDRMLILDIGCAKGYLGYQIRVRKGGDPIILGLDIWVPYMKEVKNFHVSYVRIYNDLMIADARYMPFKNRVFDIVIASEILEHLPREDGFKLLGELERICKNRIFASTPSRFFKQDELDNNPYQRHVSLWDEEDFVKLGYEVKVVYGERRKILEFTDKIRSILRLPRPLGVIVAWKTLKGARNP